MSQYDADNVHVKDEPVPPPDVNAIDSLIDAIGAGGRSRAAAETPRRPAQRVATSRTSFPRGRVPRLAVMHSAGLALAAFAAGAGITGWAVRVMQFTPSSLDGPVHPAITTARSETTPAAVPQLPVPAPVAAPPAAPPAPIPSAVVSAPAAGSAVAPEPPALPAPGIAADTTPRVEAAEAAGPARPAAAPARGTLPQVRARVERVTFPDPPRVMVAGATPSAVPGAVPLTPRPAPGAVAPPSSGTTLPPAPLPPLVAEAPRAVAGEVTLPPATLAAARPAREDEAIRTALNQYVSAYEDLDVQAAATVWPSVDRRALARAFATLKSQGLDFAGCQIRVTGLSATAHCVGTVHFVRKVGNPGPRAEDQEWRFRMQKLGPDWRIQDVSTTPSTKTAAWRPRDHSGLLEPADRHAVVTALAMAGGEREGR